MESALIVSHSEKGNEIILSLLKAISCKKITIVKTCGEARRLSLEKNFDLYIINSPVQNESAEDLAREFIQNDISQVIFFVKNDIYDYTSNKLENHGIITVPKPINRNMLWMSLKLSKASYARIKNMQKITIKLTKKISDIRTIDRAKCLLISNLFLSEADAHKMIEKKAMDERKTRREIAEDIIKEHDI